MMQEVLCTHSGLSAMALRFFMASRWSHAAVLDVDRAIVTDTTFWQGGVKEHDAAEFFAHYTSYQCRDMEVTDIEGARKFLKDQVGKSYDWTGLFWFVSEFFSQRDWQDVSKWFCSELTETVRSLFGRKRFREAMSHVSPRMMDMVV